MIARAKKLLGSERKLLTNALIFTLSTVVNKGMNFFILPVLTYYLTKADYGMLSLITSITTIAVIYIGFFPSNFIMVKFSKFKKEGMAPYISNMLFLMLSSLVVVWGILFLLRSHLFVHYEERTLLVFLIAVICFFQVFSFILSTLIQLEQNALKYAAVQFVQTIATLSLALLLIIHFQWGWKGKFYAEFFIYGLFALFTFVYMVRHRYVRFDIDPAKIRELVRYLFPLTFFVLGLFLMGTVDKIFIANMVGLEEAGVYGIAVTMTFIINMVYDAVLKAWEPQSYQLLESGKAEDRKKVVQVTYLFSGFVVLSAALYVLIIPWLFHLMINAKFDHALSFIPILVVGYAFEGLRKPISNYLNHIDKVDLVGGITILAGGLNILLNYFFIRSYGTVGAAYATTISFGFLYFATLFFVFRYCDLPWIPEKAS